MNRFYKFVAISYVFLLVLLASLTHLNVIDLKIYENISINNTLNNVVKVSLYAVNLFFIIKILTRSKENKHVKYFVFYIILTLPFAFLDDKLQFITSFLVPFATVFFIKMLKDFEEVKLKTLLQRFVIFAIITSVMQLLMYFVRFGNFEIVNAQNMGLRNYLTATIDLFFYYYVYYKVVTSNVYKSSSVLDIFLSKTDSFRKNVKNSEESINLQGLKLRQKIIFLILVYGYQFLTLAIVLSAGIVNDMFSELLAMMIIFWIGRKILGNSWHSSRLWVCSTVTFISFYILTLFPVNFEFTFFGAISLSAAFTYVLHKIAEIEDENSDLRAIKAYIKKFDIEKTTKNELTDRCSLAGMSKEETELAVELFVDKTNAKDLATKYHIAVSTIRNKKVNLKKRLLELY